MYNNWKASIQANEYIIVWNWHGHNERDVQINKYIDSWLG